MFHELLTDEILAAAPVTEPERQHYFIGKLRDYIQMQSVTAPNTYRLALIGP